MPTILTIKGWRFFFYANEGNEPVHIHWAKGEAEAKYWLLVEQFDIAEAFSFGLTPADTRFVRKTVFENFEDIALEWKEFEKRKRQHGA